MGTRADPNALLGERRQLIDLAYRLLGTLADAEDVVQETYTRWYAMPPEQQRAIEAPGAWLTRVAARVCLDQLRSARVRRERYVGEWLPEPLPSRTGNGGTTADPADRVTLDESIGMAFLVVLESMTPAERVAFILHDVYRYPFADVAGILGRTSAACRQLATSARRRIHDSQNPMPSASESRRADVVRRFKEAWAAHDVDALVGLLDPDATTIADGGGLAEAAVDPIEGGAQAALWLADIAGRVPDATFVERSVNGQPGLLCRRNGAALAVVSFEVAGDRITHIWLVRNPDKLRLWSAVVR